MKTTSKRILFITLAIAGTAAAALAHHVDTQLRPRFANQVILYAQPEVSEAQVTKMAKMINAGRVRPAAFPGSNAYLVDIPWAKDEADTEHAAFELSSFPGIEHAEVNGVGSLEGLE